VTLAVVVLTVGAGAVIDAMTRRIPNPLTLGAAVLGLVLAATGASQLTVAQSLSGFLLGMLLMLPGHLLGATGAGDVKLMAAAGTILGPHLVPIAFLYTAIAGGVLACAVAVRRGCLHRTLSGVGLVVASPRLGRSAVQATGASNRFAYAPAIAIGCLLAAMAH
jgi:prepilin peptidase CpaA